MKKPKPDLGPLADEETVQEESARIALTKAQEDADWKKIMEYPAGRRAIATVLRHCQVGSVPFKSDERFQCFVLGELNVGHWILGELRRLCIDKVRLMEDEERQNERNRKRSGSR